MLPFQERNAYFDKLFANRELLWLGQNTNHLPAHPAVTAAMIACIENEEYHAYAPPLGFPELHGLILADLGITDPDAGVLMTDGAIEALYHVVRTLCGAGDRFITTDPGWPWTNRFAESAGAEVVALSVYEAFQDYRLTPAQLAEACAAGATLIYLIDPLNPLGTAYTRAEIEAFAGIARQAGAYLVHDATYRPFAESHTLAQAFYPERTITTYSFSKWLGLAGLRLGACIADQELLARLAAAQPNNLGSSVLAQQGAIAGLRIKDQWFPEVQRVQRANQVAIHRAVSEVPGLSMPVYPSNGNFVIVDCFDAGVAPDALVQAFQTRDIMIRQAGYHSQRYAGRFVKISTTVPEAWVERLCSALPDTVVEAQQAETRAPLY